MENLIATLLANETAQDRAEAIEIIESMQEEVAEGEDIQDVLSQYDLDFDDAIDLFRFKPYCH
jgi:hypothetical protein